MDATAGQDTCSGARMRAAGPWGRGRRVAPLAGSRPRSRPTSTQCWSELPGSGVSPRPGWRGPRSKKPPSGPLRGPWLHDRLRPIRSVSPIPASDLEHAFAGLRGLLGDLRLVRPYASSRCRRSATVPRSPVAESPSTDACASGTQPANKQRLRFTSRASLDAGCARQTPKYSALPARQDVRPIFGQDAQ